jgi:hypothetical protein
MWVLSESICDALGTFRLLSLPKRKIVFFNHHARLCSLCVLPFHLLKQLTDF